MRPLEALLLLTNLLAFLLLLAPPPGIGRRARHLPPAALLVAVVQVAADGWRWQLIPAYALAGPLDGQRVHAIINAYSVAFFDQHLRGRPAKLLAGPGAPYPEVLFESRRP